MLWIFTVIKKFSIKNMKLIFKKFLVLTCILSMSISNLISKSKKGRKKSSVISQIKKSDNNKGKTKDGSKSPIVYEEKSEEPYIPTKSEKFLERSSGSVYLGTYLAPWEGMDMQETFGLDYENRDFTEYLKFIEETLDVTFITDDIVDPRDPDLNLKPINNNKISFKSNPEAPLNRRDLWQISLMFLEMAGFSVIPGNLPRTYRITTASAADDKASANREAIPTFIGTELELLPNDDTKIRYVYSVENADLETLKKIVDSIRSSSSAKVITFNQLKTLIMTDKSANIRSILKIIKELDTSNLSETLSIIRLKKANATEVQALYVNLIGKADSTKSFGYTAPKAKKSSNIRYFDESTRVIAEPRTNTLIVLGTYENVKKFEDFVKTTVDQDIELPFTPIYFYPLKYLQSESVAKTLTEAITSFNNTNATISENGGVRNGHRYFKKSVKIVSEESSNTLVISADYEEFLHLKTFLDEIDIEQPQVAIKVLILDIDLTNANELGVQLRNSVQCCDGTGDANSLLGNNINFQSAQLGAIVTNGGADTASATNGAVRILGNLLNLVNNSAIGTQGSSFVSLGKDIFGVWGLLRALQTMTRLSIVANPFLVTTHKYKAETVIGEKRRALTAIVQGQGQTQAFGDLEAKLQVIITPQISYDDLITLNVFVTIQSFVPNTNFERLFKTVSTEAIVANNEVLALGGLIRESTSTIESKVPILGDIPLIGWLFKSKTQALERRSLVILISPEIIKPNYPQTYERFTREKINDTKQNIYSVKNQVHRRDPIHRWLFNDHKDPEISKIDEFTMNQQRYLAASQNEDSSLLGLIEPETMA